MSVVVRFVIFVFVAVISYSRGGASEAELYGYLFKNYSSNVRPRKYPNNTVTVSLAFSMARFDNLDVRNRALITVGWLTLEWTDDFLEWIPSDFSGITKFVIPASNVWLPDIALDNSISDVYNSAHVESFRVAVYSDGTVVWEPGGSFSTICSIDIKFYPFDHQTCELVFANWQYTKEMVSLKNASNSINMQTFSEDGEWEVEYTRMRQDEWTDPSSPSDVYSEVILTIHARRRFMYYFINIMVPCLMMSLLVLVVFHLPPDAGEKVSLGVTVLLAFSVFQLMIAENVPSSSDTTPLLEIYLIFFMGESTFSVAIAVLVLNLHHRTEYKRPPNWLRKLVLDWMACVLFMRRMRSTSVHPDTPTNHDKDEVDNNSSVLDMGQEKVTSITVTEPTNVAMEPANITIKEPSETALAPPTMHVTESQISNTGLDIKRTTSSRDHLSPLIAKSAIKLMKSIACMEKSPSVHSKDEFMSLVRDTYRDLCNQRQTDELDAMLENEWKRIAKVVDRFFFVVTTILIIVSSGVIFGVMPYSHHDAYN